MLVDQTDALDTRSAARPGPVSTGAQWAPTE